MAYIKELEEGLEFENLKEAAKYYCTNQQEYIIDLDDLKSYIENEIGKSVKFIKKDCYEVELIEEGEELDGGAHFDTLKDALEYIKEGFFDNEEIIYGQINYFDIENDEVKKICSKERNEDIKFEVDYLNEEKAIDYYKNM